MSTGATIRYERDRPLDATAVATLFRSSGIRRPVDDLDRLRRMLEGANLTISAWEGEILVGIGRALTDFSYSCYVSDLAVAAEYQKRGIAQELLRRLQSAAGEECVFFLHAAPNAAAYYPRIGMLPWSDCFHLPRKR